MPEPPDAAPPLLLFDDRYRMAEKIGEGGMGFVYRAHDTVTGEKVAIKILRDSLGHDPVSVARIRHEAAIGAQLAHPNICQIMRLGEVGGAIYLVMPLLEGDSLWDRTAAGEPLPLDVTVRIIGDIAAGLHEVHEIGAVHRDLKPENIMLIAGPGGNERAVLLDLGLATGYSGTTARQRLTKTGMVVGTQEFMSPEQMSGKPVDRRSDIYALAFLAYEMLTGEIPFRGESMRDLAVARLKGQVIPLRERRPDLPPAVESVLAKALAVDVNARYATALEFADALRAASGEGRRRMYG
jgi:serine/threonine-protein kinase